MSSPKPRCLLASDLDGTLIPGPDHPRGGPARFRERLAASGGVALAYVTGRHHALALEGVEAAGLPLPAFLVTDVGTSIRERREGAWRLDEGYRDRMRAAMGGRRAEDLRDVLGDLGLDLQAPGRQSEFKLSYTYAAGRSARAVEEAARRRLRDAPVSLVLSRDAETEAGLLDLLPAGVAKDTAVRHLRDRLGLDDRSVLFAGDSGNDRDALLGGWLAVLVGNAPARLRADIRAEAKRRGLADRVHLARAPAADGVLEACERFGLLPPDP